MRMSASWFGSQDPPNTRLWRDDLAPAAQSPSRRRLAEPMAAPRFSWVWRTMGFATALWGALSPSFSTPNPQASPQGEKSQTKRASRASTRTHFPLDKENPIQGWGEGEREAPARRSSGAPRHLLPQAGEIEQKKSGRPQGRPDSLLSAQAFLRRRDPRDHRLGEAVDPPPRPVADAVLVGRDVDHVAEALRRRRPCRGSARR